MRKVLCFFGIHRKQEHPEWPCNQNIRKCPDCGLVYEPHLISRFQDIFLKG